MDERNEEQKTPLDELQLMRFMDGRLDAEEQAAVQARLQQSPESRRMLDALREESKLLREATENLSEPPTKIGDKVLTVLRAEHRRRVALEHARRFRNRLIALTATAALLMIGFYILSPRDQAGRVVSGTNASVARGDVATPLPKGGTLYDGDTLITGRGQFVRVVLSSSCQIDVDEDSRVAIEKGAASLIALESGRIRVSTDASKQSVLVRTSCGHIRAEQDAEFEFWLAKPCHSQLPEWTGPWTPGQEQATDQGELACLTVYRGSAYVHTNDHPRGFPVMAGWRAGFTAAKLPLYTQEFHDWEALDSRRQRWHALDGVSPSGLALLGLYPPFKWQSLGERMGLMAQDVPGGPDVANALRGAFDMLAEAEVQEDAAARAGSLSQGQQALRDASQGLPLSTELRWLGRVIEGLAHFERGRCLRAIDTKQSRADAVGAYQAAAVAFHEALAGSQRDLKTDATVAPGLGELAAPELSVSSRLSELTPVEQGLLLARFYLPWAQQAAAELSNETSKAAALAREPLPPLFEQAAALLEATAEGISARLGRARALADENRTAEALNVLAELRAFSVAGLPDTTRERVEGLRQAAHIETIRIYAARGQWTNVEEVLDAFQMRYPLSMNGPAAQEMERIRAAALGKAAEAAYAREDWLTANQLYTALLGPEAAVSMPPQLYWSMRVRHLEAALAAGKGVEAARIARSLKADGLNHLDAATRVRVDELNVKAKELFQKQRQEETNRIPDAIELDMKE